MKFVDLISHYTVIAVIILCWLEPSIPVHLIPNWLVAWSVAGYASFRAVQALNLPFDMPHHRAQAIRRWLIFFLVWFNFVSLHKLISDWLGLDEFLPMWPQLPLFVAVWLLLPVTRGALLAYSYLAPIITRQQSKVEQRLAREMGPMTVSELNRAGLIARLLSADPSQLIAAVAFVIFLPICTLFLPSAMSWPLTQMMLALAGVVLPSWFSIKALVRWDAEPPLTQQQRRKSSSHAANGAGGAAADADSLVTVGCRDGSEWLVYWLFFGLYLYSHEYIHKELFFVPFWYSLEVVALLWLQLPFTKGAMSLYSRLPFAHTYVPPKPSAAAGEGNGQAADPVPFSADDQFSIDNINRKQTAAATAASS